MRRRDALRSFAFATTGLIVSAGCGGAGPAPTPTSPPAPPPTAATATTPPAKPTAPPAPTATTPPAPAAAPTKPAAAAEVAAKPAVPTTAPASASKPTVADAAAAPKAAAATGPQTVPIPSGAVAYDPKRAFQVGDVLELPSSKVVLQVTGARSVPKDAKSEYLLIDVVVGNAGRGPQTVSSSLSFDVVTQDWRWYGTDAQEASEITARKIVPAAFDAEVPPGQARRGTVVIPVPVDAKAPALVYHGMDVDAADPATMFQDIFISLGIRGAWTPPTVPADAPVVAAGKLYRIGEAFRAPRRGATVVVNGVRDKGGDPEPERTLFVDVTVQVGSHELADQELELVDSTGGRAAAEPFSEAETIAIDGGTRALRFPGSGATARGMLVFRTAKDAKQLELRFVPWDANTDPIEGERARVDLGI